LKYKVSGKLEDVQAIALNFLLPHSKVAVANKVISPLKTGGKEPDQDGEE
jgi:hypothetical protein